MPPQMSVTAATSPKFLFWLLILLTLFLPRQNRTSEAWWVWLPVLISALAGTGIVCLMTAKEWDLLEVACSFVVGLAAVWLLMPFLESRYRMLVFFKTLLVLAGFGHLPARMLNEFVYCPRLFYYEWVEGLFAHSSDTVEGSQRHEKIDGKSDPLPEAKDAPERFHARSVELASDALGIIAKIDLVEGSGGRVTPVDYKRGAPRETPEGPEAWPADRMQVAAQALVLRENGYECPPDRGAAEERQPRTDAASRLVGHTVGARHAILLHVNRIEGGTDCRLRDFRVC